MSSYRIEAIPFKEYQTWFECNYPFLCHRSPFHHPAWLQSVARGVKFETVFIGVFQGRDLVTVVPGFLTRRGPFRFFGSPLNGTMTSYLGPVSLSPNDDPERHFDLIQSYSDFVRKEWGVVYTKLTLREEPENGHPGLDSNWHQYRAGSYRLKLSQGEAALWEGLKSDCRRNIRRALREEIEIVPFDDARLFYLILDETLRRHGSTSWHKETFFQLIFNELIPRDILWAWGAKYKGQIISAGLFFHDDQEVHFISGASLPQYGSLPTSYLLHWNAIKTAAQSGLSIFNSDASHVRSIDQFKESFRPDLEKRYTLIWAPGFIRYAQKKFKSAYNYWRGLRSRFG